MVQPSVCLKKRKACSTVKRRKYQRHTAPRSMPVDRRSRPATRAEEAAYCWVGEVLTQQIPAPGVRFLGVCELRGALGLVLPGLLHGRAGRGRANGHHDRRRNVYTTRSCADSTVSANT